MIPDVNVKDLEKNATVLLDWIIKPLPNVRGLCVEGQKEGSEDFWHSTEIIRDVRPKLLMTVRGSVYKLKGKINKLCTIDNGFSKEIADLFSNGFPKHWKEIIGRFYQQLEKSISVYEVSRTPSRKERRAAKKASILLQSVSSSKKSANTSKKSNNTSSSEKAVALLDKHPAECSSPTPAEVWTPRGLMKQQLAPSEVTVTKSGRLSLRPLATWAGQHYRYVPETGLIEVTFDTCHAKQHSKDAVLGQVKEKKPAAVNSDTKKQISKARSDAGKQLELPKERLTPNGMSKHVRTLSLTRVRTLSLTWNTSSGTAQQGSDIENSVNRKALNFSAVSTSSPKRGRTRKPITDQHGSAPQPLVDIRKSTHTSPISAAVQAREPNSTRTRMSKKNSSGNRSGNKHLSDKKNSGKHLCKSEIKIVLERCSNDTHSTPKKSKKNHETVVSQVSDEDIVRTSKLVRDPLKRGSHASKACLPSRDSTGLSTPPESELVGKTKVLVDDTQTVEKSLNKSLTGFPPCEGSTSVRKGDSSHEQKFLKLSSMQNNLNPLENNLNPLQNSVNLQQNKLIPIQNTLLPRVEKRGRKRKSENQQPDAKKDSEKKKKADPESNAAWDQKEQESLNRALKEVDVALADYWLQVSLIVGTKSELECQEFYKSSLEKITKKTKRKLPAAQKKSKPKEARPKGEAIRGGKGTLKRKKDLRAFLDEQNEGYEDNIFDSSLFTTQKKMIPSVFTVNVDKSDEEIFGSNPNCITPVANKTTVSTPGTELRAKIVSVRKTPPNVLTAAIEETPTSINRNKLDHYIKSFMDRKKKAVTTRGHNIEQVEVSKWPDSDQVLATGQLQQALPIKSLFSPASHPPSILVDSGDLEEETGPFTYYWNDDD